MMFNFFNQKSSYRLLNGENSRANYGRKTISTSFGVVRGETVNPEVDDLPAVTQFLGVPYGVAPTGQYRFNMAISAAKWTHQPKDAFSFSNVCVQSGLPKLSETEALKTMSAQRFDHIHKILPFLKPESEDCLYMNIFVPERLEKQKDPNYNQLSVLVIIHGDDFGFGTGNAFNSSILAASGQIIIVTLNYRLGVYGFMGRCEQNSCAGNSGLSDLVAALKMLSNILPSFGGDPTSVTLMGWGSGASLVSLLMASPMTQPKNRLFRRAILLDGTALAPWAMSDHPQGYFLKIAETLNCYSSEKKSEEKNQNDVFQKEISDIVRCIQDHSEKNLTLAAKKIHPPSFLNAFAPIVDGQIIPNHPRVSFSPKFGALFRDIDLLLGTVNYPAHHLLPNLDLEHGIEKERRDKILRTLVRNIFDFHRKEIFDAIVTEYTDWDNPKNHPKTIRNGILSTLGDVLYTTPLIETARMHSTDEVPKVSNTFLFLFGHETRSWTKEQPNSGVRGSLSFDYLPYIMGYPLSSRFKEDQLYFGFNNDDKNIARVMMHYVSNFVKSGDPTKPNQIQGQSPIEDRFHSTPWPQYSPASREAYLEITDRPRVKNYLKNSFVGFWSSFIPQLNKGPKDGSVPEEHHFLSDHFNKQSFFGSVRPYSALHNDPFPPPPLPPTPIPKNIKKLTTTQNPNTTPRPTLDSKEIAEIELKYAKIHAEKYSTMLIIIVVIGVVFLVLNIFVCLAAYRMCKNTRSDKKVPKYQSYAATGHMPSSDLNYIPNSPLSQQHLPPPPPSLGNNLDRQAMTAQKGSLTGSLVSQKPSVAGINTSSMTKSFINYETSNGLPQGNQFQNFQTNLNNGNHVTKLSLSEQEPLLTSKNPTPGMIRPPGISPTCPRHGRAAQMMIAQNRANSVGSALTLGTGATGPTLEEVQIVSSDEGLRLELAGTSLDRYHYGQGRGFRYVKCKNGKDNEQFRKLFIGGLSMQTTDDTLKTFYAQYGTVSDCVVMKDSTTRRSRGFGFVTFARLEDVDTAMNARPHNIDGKVVDPKRAVPREASQKNEANISTKRLYVSGVRDDHNEQMFEDYFGKYGQIEKVEIIKDKNTGKCRGFAFITFDDYDPVDKCCLERQHMVGGYRCDVKKALSKEEIAKAQQMDRDRAERGQRSRGNTRGAWMPNNPGGSDRWNPPPSGYGGGPQSYGPPAGGPPYGYGPGWTDPNSGWNPSGPWAQPSNPYGGGYSSQGPPNPQNWTNPSSWGGPRY